MMEFIRKIAGKFNGFGIASIGVTGDAHTRIGGQNTLQAAGGGLGTIGHNYLTRVNTVTNPYPTTVMQTDPCGSANRVDQGIEQRPVSNGIGAVAHPLRFTIGTGHRSAIKVVPPNHNWRPNFA